MDVTVVGAFPGAPPAGLGGQTVLIEGERITTVGRAASVPIPLAAAVVEGGGRTLRAGFIEHEAVLPRPNQPLAPEDVLLGYLARGFTTVRAVRTHSSHDALQRALEGSPLSWPRLVLVEDRGEEGAEPGPPAGPGALEVGVRADLVLVDGDGPMDVHGVMIGGRWIPRGEIVRRIEARAEGYVRQYYASIPSGSDRVRGPMELSARCTGLTLRECFGGDADCAIERPCTAGYLAPLRAELRSRLDFLAGAAPASDWIAGQRVNFALKDGALDEALAAAAACRGTAWWCQALRGLAMHERLPGSGRQRFDSALAAAPANARAWGGPGDRGLHCEWTDPLYVVQDAVLNQYRRGEPCQSGSAFERRFWWLADPLWSVPGNERLDEHIARNVHMRLHDEILRLRGSRHPASHHASVMPAGPPNSWRTVNLPSPGGGIRQRREAYVNGGYAFLPAGASFRDPVRSTADDWALRWGEGFDRMITPERWYELEHQTAVLRRQGRLLALSAARLPVLVPELEAVQTALAMGRPADLHLEVVPARLEPTGILRASADLDPDPPPDAPTPTAWRDEEAGWVASVEVLGDGWRVRARHGAPGPRLVDGFGLSDPVLVEERFEQGGLRLLDAMLPTTVLSGRSRVGVVFEVYGARADEPLQVTLAGEPVHIPRSLFRRVTGALGLTSRPPETPLRIEWQETAQPTDQGVMERYLTLDLSGIEDGEYRLVLQVERAGGQVASSFRRVQVGGR